MKNRKVISLLLALTLASTYSCTQKAAEEYVIKGSIKGINEGMVKLVQSIDSNRTSNVVDSVAIIDGKFELKGKVEHPELMALLLVPGNWRMNLFVENGNITVEGDTTGAEHYDYTAYGMDKGASLKNFKVSGSKTQDDLQQYENHPENLKFKATFAQLNNAKDTDRELLRSKADSVSEMYKKWQWTYLNDFIAKNPSSVFGPYLFNNYYQFESAMPFPEVEKVLGKFESDAKTSVYYTSAKTALENKKRVSPGQQAPDFTLLQRDSTKLALSSFKGKYVMIDFWASWCKPCREAIPHWKTVYQKYNSRGFEILGVSNDSNWKEWIRAMDKEQMPWSQVCDEFPLKNMPSRVGTLYQTPSLPTYVLIDRDGKILVHTIDEKDIDKKLEEIFN